LARGLRGFTTALGALAAAAALAGCGSGGDASVSPDAIAEAASATGSIEGAAVDMRATMKAAVFGDRELSFTGSGVQDTRHNATRITMDMSKLAEASGQTALDPDDLTMDGVYVNQHMYMRSPLFAGRSRARGSTPPRSRRTTRPTCCATCVPRAAK
jgi:hypothetical protein